MHFEIKNKTPIDALQKALNAQFRWLKIEFFTKPHGVYKSSNAQFLIGDAFRTFGEIRSENHQNEGRIFLDPEAPVWQIERLFEADFGLFVQIFRQSTGGWLETSVTDDLSLEAQNAKGREADDLAEAFAEPTEQLEPH